MIAESKQISYQPKTVDEIARNLVEMKKENRILKKRVEHLELQNNELSNQIEVKGNIEPTRTIMNWKPDNMVTTTYDQQIS